jgi:Na+/melibiose symporter-like transporter
LSLSTVFAFAATSLPINAVAIAVAVYLPRHYASHLGVSLAAVGAAFFIVRMIDIPVDGLLGWAMDKTRTRWGRYRFWSVLGAPILMLAIWWLFIPPEGVGIAYMIVFLLIMYLGNSILALSHAAWAATLAPSYHDRSRIFGVMTGVGVIGAAMALAIPIINQARGVPDQHNVETMGWLIVILTPLTVALMVWRTPERITPDVPGHRFALKDYWALVARPSMARILAADLCLSLGPGWMASLYLFFFTASRGFTTAEASILLAVYILAGFAGAPLMGRLAMRISKHRAVMVASTGYSLVLMSIILVPKGNMVIAFFPMFLAGFLAAGFTVLTRAMTADIADEVRLEQGKERSGLLFAITTMTSKIAAAFSIGLTFLVLDMVGYVAKEGAVNTPEAIFNLELAYLIGPIVFVMLGGICMIGYRLGEERHADIRRQLDERDALYDEAPIIESVSGQAAIAVPGSGVVRLPDAR